MHQLLRSLKTKPPPSLAGVSHTNTVSSAYGAEDEVAGTSIDIAGASLDISDDRADDASDTAELIAASAEDSAEDTAAEETADEAGASDETTTTAEDDGAGAALDTTAELDGATGTTGVGVPRLKIQIRPMITITATMMIIQVLRFIRACLVLEETSGKFVVLS